MSPTLLYNFLDDFAETAAVLEAPFFIGEWGVIDGGSDSAGWLAASVDAMEQRQIPSTIWCRGGTGGAFAVYDDFDPMPVHENLLLRPFPHAVAADDYRFRSQPWTGVFEIELDIGSEPLCAPTEVVVPRAIGGASLGYRVEEGEAELRYDEERQRLLVVPRCRDCVVRVTSVR